jgi:hypothetical protein
VVLAWITRTMMELGMRCVGNMSFGVVSHGHIPCVCGGIRACNYACAAHQGWHHLMCDSTTAHLASEELDM